MSFPYIQDTVVIYTESEQKKARELLAAAKPRLGSIFPSSNIVLSPSLSLSFFLVFFLILII